MKLSKLMMHSYVIAGILTAVTILGSCNKDEDPPTPTPPMTIDPPIELDCRYFSENKNAVLKDNPNAPVDYIISCKMAINDDVTIEAGTTIAFETDAGLVVNEQGSLTTSGTSNLPITLTGTDKTRGSWSGIIFYSNDVKNKMQHTVVEYAGGSAFNSNNNKGAVIAYADSRLSMNNCTLRHSAEYGLNADYRNITLDLKNNVYTSNKSPMRLRADLLGMASPSDRHTGNDEDKVVLNLYTASLSEPVTWKKIDVPYRTIVTSNPIPQLAINTALTIEPGVIVEMGQGAELRINENGSMNAVGTENDPIIFRGTVNQPGSWGTIYFTHTQSPLNRLHHMEIRNAGEGSNKGAVYMWAKPTLSVQNVHFADIKTCAIYAAPGTSSPNTNLTTANLTYSNVGGEICGD